MIFILGCNKSWLMDILSGGLQWTWTIGTIDVNLWKASLLSMLNMFITWIESFCNVSWLIWISSIDNMINNALKNNVFLHELLFYGTQLVNKKSCCRNSSIFFGNPMIHWFFGHFKGNSLIAIWSVPLGTSKS